MSDYDPRGAEEGTPDWPAIAGGSLPNVPARSSVETCGRIAGPVANMAANQNFEPVADTPRSGYVLFAPLSVVLRRGVDEGAGELPATPRMGKIGRAWGRERGGQ